jgi:FtsP/CotA-like multicopper oxidase with cupredoxin domain
VGGTVTYTFTATKPGTYLYQSGSRPELSVEMGLVGALIVRPAGYAEGDHATHPFRTAYGTPPGATAGYQPTHYDREYLFLLTEMDRSAHEAIDTRQQAFAAGTGASFDDPALDAVPGATVDPSAFKATLWFMNGRNAPDTMLQRSVQWMPSQPYNALARSHAGERVLMRIIGAGRDLHPFHHHGNNAWLVARDGRLLESTPGTLAPYPDYDCLPEFDPDYATRVTGGNCPNVGAAAKASAGTAKLPDQAISNFTIQVVPGSTYDAIFTWTGRGLNWDIYGSQPGHTAGNGTCDESTRLPGEDPVSHCHLFSDAMGARSFPVTLPEQQSLTFGGFWSGGPYLGTAQPIPPLQGGLNPGAGYTFMWHSHTERELTNDDVFPGGMMTMFILEQEPAASDPDNICNDGTFFTGAPCAP